MLLQQTLDALHRLNLKGMAEALRQQQEDELYRDMTFEDRLGLLVDRESVEQGNRRLAARLKRARLRQDSVIEDLDFRAARGLDRSLVAELASCAWIRRHDNLLIVGPTGVGKTYLACGLAHKACREGFTAIYHRLPRLLLELNMARGEGRYLRLLKTLSQPDLLLLDDWGLEPLAKDQRHDLLEILEDRHGRKSTLVTSQLPRDQWHVFLGDPTVADAILDRLVHSAQTITLKGDSMRKTLRQTSKARATT